jgi:hypothetical protein
MLLTYQVQDLSNQSRSDQPWNNDSLHFRRPFSNLQQFLVSIEPLDIIFLHLAATIVELDRVVYKPVHHLQAVELGHRRFFPEGLAVSSQPARFAGEQPSTFSFKDHVRQVECINLVGSDRLSELNSFLALFHGHFKAALRPADLHSRNGEATTIQRLHHLIESMPPRSKKVLLRNRAVIKKELSRIRTAPHHLPIHLFGDDKNAGKLGAAICLSACPAKSRHARRDFSGSIGDKDLASIDHSLVAL